LVHHVQDKWTAATQDGRRSAQFEHTLLITEDGVEALTGKLPDSPKYFWEV
jgi:methionyl aminopeptidase